MAPMSTGDAWRRGLSLTDQSWVEAALEGMPVMIDETHTFRDPLLVERQKTHGSFNQNAIISQQLKAVFETYGSKDFIPAHREALDMIALKLSRILSGQASFKDHWDDIAGYAKLASEACDAKDSSNR